MNKTILAAALSVGLAGHGNAADDDNILVIEVGGVATGTIEIELLPEVAPQHVARIKQLALEGAYDNIVFHRVIEGFMAQTGDVQFGSKNGENLSSAGMGGSEYPDLPAEFSDIPYEKGTVGMARAAPPNSANSQFFIMFADAPFLNGQYTVFGKVISGNEVVDAIKKGNANANGLVTDPDYMVSVKLKSDL